MSDESTRGRRASDIPPADALPGSEGERSREAGDPADEGAGGSGRRFERASVDSDADRRAQTPTETIPRHPDPDRRAETGSVDPKERVREMRERQRQEFGGFNLGAAFFGWLVAVGLGALLTALLSAVGAGVGLTASPGEAAESADTVGIGGAVALLVVLFLAYYAGGYVAGRMSRFNGAKQGFGVWAIALAVTLILAALAAVLGSEFNILSQLNLPRIPVDEGTLATGGLITLIGVLLVTLIAAVLGGKVGVRWHKKIDRAGVGA
jgi:hypothetical protein